MKHALMSFAAALCVGAAAVAQAPDSCEEYLLQLDDRLASATDLYEEAAGTRVQDQFLDAMVRSWEALDDAVAECDGRRWTYGNAVERLHFLGPLRIADALRRSLPSVEHGHWAVRREDVARLFLEHLDLVDAWYGVYLDQYDGFVPDTISPRERSAAVAGRSEVLAIKARVEDALGREGARRERLAALEREIASILGVRGLDQVTAPIAYTGNVVLDTLTMDWLETLALVESPEAFVAACRRAALWMEGSQRSPDGVPSMGPTQVMVDVAKGWASDRVNAAQVLEISEMVRAAHRDWWHGEYDADVDNARAHLDGAQAAIDLGRFDEARRLLDDLARIPGVHPAHLEEAADHARRLERRRQRALARSAVALALEMAGVEALPERREEQLAPDPEPPPTVAVASAAPASAGFPGPPDAVTAAAPATPSSLRTAPARSRRPAVRAVGAGLAACGAAALVVIARRRRRAGGHHPTES